MQISPLILKLHLVAFFCIIFSIRQYGKAKQLRIDTQNRLAISKLWNDLTETNKEKLGQYIVPIIAKDIHSNIPSANIKVESALGKVSVEDSTKGDKS